MFPSYEHYLKFHLKSVKYPIIFTCSVLSLCFINNQSNMGIFNLYVGMFSIFFVVFINIFFSSKAYWVYCVFSKKFDIDYQKLKKYDGNFFLKSKLNFFIFLSCYVLFCLLFIYSLSVLLNELSFSEEFVILFLGFFILPVLLVFFVRVLSQFNLKASVIYLDNYSGQNIEMNGVSLNEIIFIEILASVFVNVSIVFPIFEKKNFLLTNGVLEPEFIISMVVLLYSVLIVMLILSKNKRMYIFMGFILLYGMDINQNKFTKPSLIMKSLIFFVIPIFVIVTCFLFSLVNFHYDSWVIYVLCLLPVYYIYYRKRLEALHGDLLHAFDMVLRLKALNNSLK